MNDTKNGFDNRTTSTSGTNSPNKNPGSNSTKNKRREYTSRKISSHKNSSDAHCSLMHVSMKFIELEGIQILRRKKKKDIFRAKGFLFCNKKDEFSNQSGVIPQSSREQREPLLNDRNRPLYHVVASFCHMSYDGDMKKFTDVPSEPINYNSVKEYGCHSVLVTWKKSSWIDSTPTEDESFNQSSRIIRFPQILFRKSHRNPYIIKTDDNHINKNSQFRPKKIVIGLGIMGGDEVKTIGFVEVVIDGEIEEKLLSLPVSLDQSITGDDKRKKKNSSQKKNKRFFQNHQIQAEYATKVIPLLTTREDDDYYICFRNPTFHLNLSITSFLSNGIRNVASTSNSKKKIHGSKQPVNFEIDNKKKEREVNCLSDAFFKTSNYTLINLLPGENDEDESSSSLSKTAPMDISQRISMSRRSHLLHNQHSSRQRLFLHNHKTKDDTSSYIYWDPFELLEENSSPCVEALDLASEHSSSRSLFNSTISSDDHKQAFGKYHFRILADGELSENNGNNDRGLDITSSLHVPLQKC